MIHIVVSKTLHVITFTFLRFLTFFKIQKNVTFYFFCFVAYFFLNIGCDLEIHTRGGLFKIIDKRSK